MLLKRSFFYARVFSDTNIYKVYISERDSFKYGAEVIIITELGTDLAVITSFKCMENSRTNNCYVSGSLIRYATQDDKIKKTLLQKKSSSLKLKVNSLIRDFQLKMNLSHILVPLSDNSICIYYTANNRIDFRSLLIELKKKFKSKIILKQITQEQRELSFGFDLNYSSGLKSF